MSRCAFHRIVDSMDQMTRYYAELSMGIPPSDPFLWSACWTLLDPTRAPEGKHTLICDTFVSNWLASGETWAEIGEDYTRRVLLGKLRQYAPNMNDDNILGLAVHTARTWRPPTPLSSRAPPTAASESSHSSAASARSRATPLPLAGTRPVHDRAPLPPRRRHLGHGTITANVMLDDMGIKPADFW